MPITSQQFLYSYGRAHAGPTTLKEYFDQRMRGSCVLHHTADWERPAPPALTPANFYDYVPRDKIPGPHPHGLTEISRALGYRLVEFSLRCLEGAVAAWIARSGIEPTPEEIVAAVPDYTGLQEDSDNPAWMVSRAFSNWVVKEAVINALHSRWGHPQNPRATPRTIPDTLLAPADSRRYPYSFAAPGSTQPLDLYGYLRQRAQDYPAMLGQAKWELDLDDLPRRQFDYNDFWFMVGRPARVNLRQASLALSYRLVWLALKYLEDCAADLVKRRQVEPTPEEIMAQFHATAKRWRPERHGDDMEMYAKITAHPVLAAAITNALHSRWGHPRNPRAVAPAGAAPVSARLLMKAISSRS
ncbi:MAG: hypothetical protein INR62_08250 [Rhodospirillales bacterium]|nr:hypothetical protein [Acetobacter sp.]